MEGRREILIKYREIYDMYRKYNNEGGIGLCQERLVFHEVTQVVNYIQNGKFFTEHNYYDALLGKCIIVYKNTEFSSSY